MEVVEEMVLGRQAQLDKAMLEEVKLVQRMSGLVVVVLVQLAKVLVVQVEEMAALVQQVQFPVHP